jgi:hypothetical protein
MRQCRLLLFCVVLALPTLALAQAQLTLASLDSGDQAITAQAWQALPRTRVQAVDHDGHEATFEGVAAGDLLKLVQAPLGALRGRNLALYVVADAADGYRSVFALPEFDPAFTDRVILVADRRNGEALGQDEGPLRIVVPGEKRQARWVRKLQRLSVKRAD